jgi:hypothetical protein
VHTWSHKHVTHVRAENDVEKSDSMRRWGGLGLGWRRREESNSGGEADGNGGGDDAPS